MPIDQRHITLTITRNIGQSPALPETTQISELSLLKQLKVEDLVEDHRIDFHDIVDEREAES